MDSDAALRWFYEECIEVGPEICPIYEDTVPKVWDRVDRLLKTLKVQPVTFYNESSGIYGEVDYSVAKFAIFSSLYKLHSVGRKLSVALADLEKGNAQTMYELASKKIDHASFSCECPIETPGTSSQGSDVNLAIACTDGRAVEYTLEELQEFYDDMSLISTFADVMTRRIGCS